MLNIKQKKAVVYWGYRDQHQIRVEEPVSVFRDYFAGTNAAEHDYVRCPSLRKSLHNSFGLKSLFDYDLNFEGDSVTSSKHDQNFYDTLVKIRNKRIRLASLAFNYLFIAEDESLEMEYQPAFLANNAFTKSAILIPGTVDIGKYIRNLDCAFHSRDNQMSIDEGDIYAYVKFNTDKEIEFKRFLYTSDIEDIQRQTDISGYRRPTFKPLEWFYKKQQLMKTKQRVLLEAKKNLL